MAPSVGHYTRSKAPKGKQTKKKVQGTRQVQLCIFVFCLLLFLSTLTTSNVVVVVVSPGVDDGATFGPCVGMKTAQIVLKLVVQWATSKRKRWSHSDWASDLSFSCFLSASIQFLRKRFGNGATSTASFSCSTRVNRDFKWRISSLLPVVLIRCVGFGVWTVLFGLRGCAVCIFAVASGSKKKCLRDDHGTTIRW